MRKRFFKVKEKESLSWGGKREKKKNTERWRMNVVKGLNGKDDHHDPGKRHTVEKAGRLAQ